MLDVRSWVVYAACAVLVSLAAAASARGQSVYEVEADHPVSLRALIDVRLVRAGKAPSWMEGGPGKTRYGGVDTPEGFERVVRFALSQFALEPSAVLPAGIQAHAQLNWEADVDDRGDITNDTWPRLIEGWLRREWHRGEGGWSAQGGVINPPFTFENTGPAWTPRYSLTPSALTSWLWEEGRIVGLEGEWWQRSAGGWRTGAVAGAGWGPDEMGLLVAQRGWVLSDYLAGVNTTLPLPSGASTHVFDERDGRPALYAGLTLRDPLQIGQLRAGYFDNLGNRNVSGVWHTRYGVAGVVLQPLPGLDVLAQGLLGSGGGAGTDTTISAWYPLVSYRYRAHRFTARYDWFRLDGGDQLPERGQAVTIAYLFEFWLRHRLAFEYIWVDSDRSGISDPSDNGFQLSYRFRY